MKTKVFEVRDRVTMIPVLAIKLEAENIQQQKLLHHAGYSPRQPYYLMLHIVSFKFQYDSHAWNDRTLGRAHHYIEQNFDKMVDGEVIDIEYILGETTQPKVSDLQYSPEIEQLERAARFAQTLLKKKKEYYDS
jgi:hypothetical protein